MKQQRITRNYIRAGLGRWPRKRPYHIIKSCEAWVYRMRKQHPDIPESFWWAEVEHVIKTATKMRNAGG